MKPPKPLRETPPFLTLLTCTFRRPKALERNFRSVASQTRVEDIEQIVLPDHVGYGWDSMFGRAAWYVDAVRGEWVAWLGDDDVLSDPMVVQRLQAAILPDSQVVIVRVQKGDTTFPRSFPIPPKEGDVDLGCYILRRNIWRRHAGDYGHRYQGDFDHALVLHERGYQTQVLSMVFAEGPASGGRPEVDW